MIDESFHEKIQEILSTLNEHKELCLHGGFMGILPIHRRNYIFRQDGYLGFQVLVSSREQLPHRGAGVHFARENLQRDNL